MIDKNELWLELTWFNFDHLRSVFTPGDRIVMDFVENRVLWQILSWHGSWGQRTRLCRQLSTGIFIRSSLCVEYLWRVFFCPCFCPSGRTRKNWLDRSAARRWGHVSTLPCSPWTPPPSSIANWGRGLQQQRQIVAVKSDVTPCKLCLTFGSVKHLVLGLGGVAVGHRAVVANHPRTCLDQSPKISKNQT